MTTCRLGMQLCIGRVLSIYAYIMVQESMLYNSEVNYSDHGILPSRMRWLGSIIPPRNLASGPSLRPYRSLVIDFSRRLELLYELIHGPIGRLKVNDMSLALPRVSETLLTRSALEKPSCPGAGESTRDVYPLAPPYTADPEPPNDLPSMKALASFSDVSS